MSAWCTLILLGYRTAAAVFDYAEALQSGTVLLAHAGV